MSARVDAIVIGAGVSGLIAALYLKRAGKRVLVVEAGETPGGRGASYLTALDPRAVKELGLNARGLKFALRDLKLVSLRQDGRHLILARDPHEAARAIAAHSPADAEAYRRYHLEVFSLGRALRPWWWEDVPAPALASVSDRRLLARLAMTSAAAYLSGWFESEALKTALAFDVPDPFAPGSALVLAWRAAQETGGLQGASAVPQGGVAQLARILTAMAGDAGIELRSKARVARIVLAENAVAGAELDSGESVFAPAVLSSLDRRTTLLELAPTASAGLAETERLIRAAQRLSQSEFRFTLNAAPSFGPDGARFIVTEGEPQLEAVASASQAPGQHLLAVTAKGAPSADQVIAQLERYTPHLRGRIVGQESHTHDMAAPQPMASAASRIATPIGGLFLCGGDAEPVETISGRAGRLAAQMALREKRP